MSHWAEIRARARKQHQVLLAAAQGTPSADALLTAAALQTDIHPYPVPAGDPLLGSAQAVLDRKAQSIFYVQETHPSLVPLLIAHEYAHLWLGHGDRTCCSAEQIDPEASDEDIPLGVAGFLSVVVPWFCRDGLAGLPGCYATVYGGGAAWRELSRGETLSTFRVE